MDRRVSGKDKNLNIVIALIIFGIIVLIHEFGHFLFAKLSGVKVVEFSVGMGPRIFSVKGKETRYSLKLLPLGGSCAMYGEDEDEDAPGSFNSAPLLGRIATIAAGPFFNFILAFLVAIFIVANVGVDKPVISGFVSGLPAESSGLMVGDEIEKINGRDIFFYRSVSTYLFMNQGKDITLTVKRNNEKQTITVTPMYNEEYSQYMIGIKSSGYEKLKNPFSILKYSVLEVKYTISMTVDSLIYLLRGRAKASEISGPVGIVNMIGTTVNESKPYGIFVVLLSLSQMVLLLSANLGVMNLLPLPALDGGRLIFLFLEAIFRRPLNRKVEGYIHFAGFALLMLLMVFVMFNDIRKII